MDNQSMRTATAAAAAAKSINSACQQMGNFLQAIYFEACGRGHCNLPQQFYIYSNESLKQLTKIVIVIYFFLFLVLF